MPQLTVTAHKIADGVYNVSPKGSIDSDTYMTLQKKLGEIMRPTPRMIVFDMRDVDYISSMGLKVLLDAKNGVESGGGMLLMVNLKPQITKVFDIIKAIPSNNIFANREELDRYLADMQRKEIDKGKSA
jgi:anti-sigma B factor antagonist